MASTDISLTADRLRRARSTGDIQDRIPRSIDSARHNAAHIEIVPGEDVFHDILPFPPAGAPFRGDPGRRAYSSFATDTLVDLPSPPLNTLPSSFERRRSTSVHMLDTRPLPRPPPHSTVPSVRSRGWRGFLRKAYTFFGYGENNRTRKELVSLVWNLSFGFIQIVVTATLVAYSTRHRSPTHPSTEWKACDRPLGIWNSLWLARVSLGCFMTGWGWCRDRRIRLANRSRSSDVETGNVSNTVQLEMPQVTSTPVSARRHQSSASNGTTGRNQRGRQPLLPYARLYARLSLLLSLLSMSWFLTAHILVYTSLQTCRLAAPHLWWLTFGILCILYSMVLEVVCIAVVVFILGPLLFLFWNLFLICIGRHPLQNPHYINPEIGKLPKSVVDCLPLVFYIPPPPDESDKDVITPPTPMYSPGSEHVYPPKPAARTKRRFAFLRPRSRKSASSKGHGTTSGDSAQTEKGEKTAWEDNWERGEYPFVRLEENRAACAICLLDFEEPKKVHGAMGDSKNETSATTPHVQPQSSLEGPRQEEIQEVPLRETNDERQDQLQLEDAGEGAQPLRLLPCGHVFHKTCVDPWLMDVSGRCPTCQRAITSPGGKSERNNRGR